MMQAPGKEVSCHHRSIQQGFAFGVYALGLGGVAACSSLQSLTAAAMHCSWAVDDCAISANARLVSVAAADRRDKLYFERVRLRRSLVCSLTAAHTDCS
jgi:hypothetical protein